MSTVTLDVAAARRRFSALRTDLAFFDGPGGTQVPDSVIDAISSYLRESNANLGGPYGTSRRTEALVARARLAAADFLGCATEEATTVASRRWSSSRRSCRATMNRSCPTTSRGCCHRRRSRCARRRCGR